MYKVLYNKPRSIKEKNVIKNHLILLKKCFFDEI